MFIMNLWSYICYTVIFEDIREYGLLECFIQLQKLYLSDKDRDSSGYVYKSKMLKTQYFLPPDICAYQGLRNVRF